MTDLIRREDAIKALMEIPAVKQEDNKQTNRMPECNEHCIQTEIGCNEPDCAWK